MTIQSCYCGDCRNDSEHSIGFVWERKDGVWSKSYSIKDTSTRGIHYPYTPFYPVYL